MNTMKDNEIGRVFEWGVQHGQDPNAMVEHRIESLNGGARTSLMMVPGADLILSAATQEHLFGHMPPAYRRNRNDWLIQSGAIMYVQVLVLYEATIVLVILLAVRNCRNH